MTWDATPLHAMFRQITADKVRDDLAKLSLEDLRREWDAIGEDSYSPRGFDCADIHAEMNRRGDGNYCAV